MEKIIKQKKSLIQFKQNISKSDFFKSLLEDPNEYLSTRPDVNLIQNEYTQRLIPQSDPLIQNIKQLIKEQEDEETLVNKYQKLQFEKKINVKQAISKQMNFIQNKDFYGSNDLGELEQYDRKKKTKHPQGYQFICNQGLEGDAKKAVLEKKLKNPDYNSDHDILTRAQRLSKIYTLGFKVHDFMSPRERRIKLQTQNLMMQTGTLTGAKQSIQADSRHQFNKSTDSFLQDSNNPLQSQSITDLPQLSRSQNVQVQPPTQSNLGSNSSLQQKKLNFAELEKEVLKRKYIGTHMDQELSLQQLQLLRQKMCQELFSPNITVAKKYITISDLFEKELTEGKKKIYFKKIKLQREKQRLEMLSRQQAFNSFYNLLAMTKKQKKVISFKQQLQNKTNPDRKRDLKLSRFDFNSQSISNPQIKNIQSKIKTGILKNQQSTKKQLQRVASGYDVYENPYNQKTYYTSE